jgi:cyclic pyranopterin phosphate synthase
MSTAALAPPAAATMSPDVQPIGSPAAPSTLHDQFGRRIEYLRISVTDRCNFRCVYCMPLAGLPWLPRESILTDDEIVAVVRELAPMGLRRIRLTGGEPTLRADLPELVARLRAVPGIEDLSLSTNGTRLVEQASALRAAGLDRVNVSVDSLRPERVVAIARRGRAFDPATAIEAAQAAGLAPIKLNVVLIRGRNDDEIEALAALALDRPWHVRFIELMPVGELAEREAVDGRDPLALVVPSDDVLARIAALGEAVGRPLEAWGGPARGNGPAAYHRFAGGVGSVGVITPMSHTYCGTCNRVRLTADGRLRTCLYGEHEVSLRDAVRAGLPLAPLVHAAMADKPREHALLALRVGGLRALSQVGG